MNITKKLITPSYAKELLEANTKNRNLSPALVYRYSKDIANGCWKEDTAEAIKISKTNVVLDGQHRLHAIIKANKPTYMHVVVDLEDSIFDVLDTGKSRSVNDAFKIDGIKQSNNIPSIILKYRLLKKGKVKSDGRKDTTTNAEILEFYKQKESYWQNIGKKSISWYAQFAKILSPSMIGGFYSFLSDISQKDAEDFMNQLATGNDVKSNSINLLRAKLMTDKIAPKKMPIELRSALIIKAWNFYRKNENPKLLKWDASVEPFPKAI